MGSFTFSKKQLNDIDLAKNTDIVKVCEHFGWDIDSNGKLVDDHSVQIQPEYNSFKDWAYTDSKHRGDVIAFLQYYYNKSQNLPGQMKFFDAVKMLIEIRKEYDPKMVNKVGQDYDKKPPIPADLRNKEMVRYLTEGVVGADKSDPNYAALTKDGKFNIKTISNNTRNKFHKNISIGSPSDRNKVSVGDGYGQGYGYSAMGYLSGIRGISEETVKDLMEKGYILNTTYNWAAKTDEELQRMGMKNTVPYIVVEDGKSYPANADGKRWKNNPGKPVQEETYFRYKNIPRVAFVSYDQDGRLNYIEEKGCSTPAAGSKYRNIFCYHGQNKEYSYPEKSWFYDPKCDLSAKNEYTRTVLNAIRPHNKDSFNLKDKVPANDISTQGKDRTLCVFESVIDAISTIDLMKREGKDLNSYAFASVGGISKAKNKIEELCSTYGFKKVDIYFDRDVEGINAAKDIKFVLEADLGLSVFNANSMQHMPEIPCKDMNDILIEVNRGTIDYKLPDREKERSKPKVEKSVKPIIKEPVKQVSKPKSDLEEIFGTSGDDNFVADYDDYNFNEDFDDEDLEEAYL